MIKINKYIPVVLFVISPLLAFFLAFIKALYNNSQRAFDVLLLLTCSILGLINSGKVIESDLILYSQQFEFSSQLTYFEYLILNFKDPIYYSLNYFFYNLISTDFKLFLFFITFISYYFLIKASFNFARAVGLNYRFSIFVVILTALFPQIFSFSGHLLRQFLAVSFGYYCLSIFYFKQKSRWPVFGLILSCFIHSSNLLFIGLLFFKLKIKILLKLSLALIPLGIFFYSQLGSDNVIFNGFKRIKNLNSGSAELESISFSVLVLSAAFLLVNVIVNFYDKKNISKTIFDRIFILLTFIFLFFAFINNTELSIRLLPNLYFIWPIIYALFLNKIGASVHLLLLFLIIIFGTFVLSLLIGTWEYENLYLILFPMISFLN